MGLRAVLCAVYFVTRPIYGFYEPCTPDVGCKWNVRNALPLSCCGGGPYLPTDPPCLPPLLNAPVNCQTGASVNPIYQQQQNPNSFFNIPPLYPGVPKVVCWTLCPNSQVINPQPPLLQFPSSFVNNAQQYTGHPPPVNYLQPLPSPPFSYHTGSRSLSTNNQYESQQNPMINYPQKHQSPPITGPEAVRLVTLAPPEPRRPLFAFGLLGLTGNPKPNNTLQGIVKKSDNKRLEPLLNAPREAVSSTAKTMQPEEHRALPINYKLSIDQIPSSQINYPQQHPAPLSQAYPRQYPSAPQQFPYPPPIINYPGSQISYPQPYPKTIPDFMLKYFQKDPTLNQPPYPLNYYSQQYPTARLEPVQPAVGLPFPPEPVWKSLFNLMPPAKTQSPPFNNMLPKLDQNNRFNFLPPNEQYRGPQINYPQQYPDIQLPVNFQRNLSPPSNQYPLIRLLPSQTVGQPTAIRNSINSLPPVNQYQSPYIFPQQYPNLQLPVNYYPQSYPTSLSNYPQIYPSHPMNYHQTLLNTPPINYPTASRDLSPNSYIEEFPAAKPGMYSPVNSGPLNSYLLPYQNPNIPPRSVWNPIPPYPTYSPIEGVKNSLINNMPLTNPQNSEYNYIPLDEPYWRVPVNHSQWLPNVSPIQQQPKIPFFNSYFEQNPYPMMKFPQIYPSSAMNYPEQYPRLLTNDIVPQEPNLMVTGPPPPALSYTTQQYPSLQLPVNYHPQSYPTSLSNYPQIYPSHPMNYYPTLLNTPPINYPTASRDLSPNSYIEEFPAAKPGMYSPVNSGPLNSYLLPYQNPNIPPRSVWNPIPPYPTYSPIEGVKNSLINNMPLTNPQNSEYNYIPLDEPYWRVPVNHSQWLPNVSPIQQQPKIPFFNSYFEQNPYPMMKFPQIYPSSAMNYPEQYPRLLTNDIVPQEPNLMVTGPPPPALSYTTQQYPSLQLPVNYHPQSYPTSLSNYPQIYPSHPMNYYPTLLNTPPINYPTASRDLSPNSYIEEFPAAKPGMYSPVNSGPLNSYLLPYQNPYVPPRSVWNPIPPYPTYTPIGGVKNSLINNMPLTTPQNSENNYIPLDEPYWRVPLDHSLWLPNFSPSQQQTKIPFFNSHVEQNPHPMMKYPQIYPISAMNYPEQYPRSLSNDIVPQEPSLMVTGPPPPGTVGKRLFKQKPSRLLNDTPYYQMGINSISPKVDLEQYPSSFMKYPSEYQNPIVNYPQWDDNYLQHILGSTANFPMQYPTMNYQQQYPSSLADYPQPLPYVSPYDYQGRMSLPISREKYPLPYLSPMANNVPWYMGAPLNNYYPQQYSSYFPQQYPSFPLFGSSPSDLSQSPFNSLPSGSFPYPYADSWAARNSLLNFIPPDEGEADASSDARNEVYNQTNYQPDK